MDPLLLPFLGAQGKAEKWLAGLISEIADPVICSILYRKLHVSLKSSDGSLQNQDALDLAQNLRALVVSELRNLKADQDRRAISDFRQYVAVKAYSACADYFRKKHPQRWRLKNALRYQLKQNRQFTLREDERGKWACGLSCWGASGSRAQSDGRLPESVDARTLFPQGREVLQQAPLTELLQEILTKAGRPLGLDQLVAIVAEVKGVQDHPVESYDQDRILGENLVDHALATDAALEQHLYLTSLWEEVCSLRPLQRAALLLNLRDANSDSVISFLPLLGIASKNEIAELVGIGDEKFSELWNELPLEDSVIAQLLGVTRQQVINLRKTARERLARRIQAREKAWSKTTGRQ